MTSTRLDVGKASNEVRKLPDEFKSERMKDRGLFELIDAVRMREEEDVDPESRRLVERMHRGVVMNRVEYRREHEGTLQNVLSNLELGQGENEGKVKINLDDYNHCKVSTSVKDSETRQKFEFATSNKCAQNVPLLKEVVVLRAEAAKLLGYESHAALRLEDRIAKTPETVIAFLEGLRSRLVGSGKEELDKLKELNRKDFEARGESFDNCSYPWYYAFYNRQLVKEEYSVDMKKVGEYFEVHTTMQKILKNFEELFGLQFHDIRRQDAVVWDEEALGGGFLGYLYLDLFDRDYKDSGIFNCTLELGYMREDGTRHYPSTVLFCSFFKHTPAKPCLLSQFNLVMLFHEFGHGIHNLIVAGIVGSKYCGKPGFLLGQVLFALVDIKMHLHQDTETGKCMDLTREYNEMVTEIQISQVYSTDMFYSAFAGDLTNRAEGRRYWTVLLEKGGSQDEMKTLKEFLGRDPSIEPFYKDLALD
ncbi:hypothetical protein BKA61DRAFT_634902 [Leptodontidium sp. MPI-SDFR-AT-0119]|nr:hypothetical protein BKA61DRAFT_634902 [Leptodontidium sp. MPI-SDFR-AT-0119]